MDPLQLVFFILLFIWSAFFSWSELALMSIPEHKLQSLVKSKKYWASSLKKIKKNNDRLLITILIWNNLVNVYTAALATTIAISIWISMWIPQATVIWIATWLITFLLLLFWEIIPKSLATKNATKIALYVAPVYNILMKILFPIIILIELIIRIFSSKAKIEKMTGEEIESFIDMWRKTWTLEKDEHEKIINILEFWDIIVEEIMVPRVKIECLSTEDTVWKALDFYMAHTHSRIPVYNQTIDKIDNFFTIRDIINEDRNKKLKDLKLSSVVRVPLNQPIDILLKTFQSTRKHLAIVIDEYGWVAWLVTLEDVLEEVFWEIRDETDKEVDEINFVSKDNYIAESDILIDDILDKYNLNLEDIWLDEREFSWETLSYIITHILERFPKQWEIIEFEIKNNQLLNWIIELKIVDINNWRIGKVEVKRKVIV